MAKWLTNSINTIAGVAKQSGTMIRPYVPHAVAQWIDSNPSDNDHLNPFGRCDRSNGRNDVCNTNVHFSVYSNDSAEVSITMNKDTVDNEAFGVNGSVERETSKENGMVSTCLFRTDNAEAWIEITFQHNDAEMRHFRY